MKLNMKFIFINLLIFSLLACNSMQRLDKAYQKTNKSDYYTALAAGYKAISAREKKEFDWQDSEYFADKGLRALKHQSVRPGLIEDRDINDNLTLDELFTARDKLLELVDDQTKQNFPAKSARLYILFDFWLEQAEENWQSKQITRFRAEFWQTYKALNAAKLLLAKKEKQRPNNQKFRTIFFDHDKVHLDRTALKEINRILVFLRQLDNYKIIIEGYTDLSGGYNYNLELARKRLLAVKNKLIAEGIPAKKFIREKSYGKVKPTISQKLGGMEERLNRRVELYIITK
jgi:OmpA-OmpF porin, OOP family